MKELLNLLETYFEYAKFLIYNELITESEIFDNLIQLNVKIDNDLKKISTIGENKLAFKKTILDTIKLMQKVKFWYDIKLNDDKTQQTVYKFYKKNLLPKFTKFWQLCNEYNKKYNLNEDSGLQSIKTLIDAINRGTTNQLGLKSIETYFNY